MSDFKGTPGPWMINVIGPHWNNKSLTHIEITFGDDGECICDTVYKSEDAQLIAAAPELLEALQDALHAYDKHGEHSEWDFARTAIAKALGETK